MSWLNPLLAQEANTVPLSQTSTTKENVWPKNKTDNGNVRATRHDVSIHGGLSFVTSKVYVEGDSYTWRRGRELSVQYHYMFPGNWGLGASIDHNFTDYPGADITLLYYGLSVIYQYPLSRRWNVGGGFGLGIAKYDDQEKKDHGVGIKTHFGVEYLISKNWGVSLEGNSLLSLLNDDDRSTPIGDTPGISRTGLLLGLHFHF